MTNNDKTFYQARTFTDDGFIDQQIQARVTTQGVSALTIFQGRRFGDTADQATIYLDKAQWAELAEKAARMSEELEELEQQKKDRSVTHWNTQQVTEWQDENTRQHILRVARSLIETLERAGQITHAYATASSTGYGQRALDLLVEKRIARTVTKGRMVMIELTVPEAEALKTLEA